MSKNYLENIRLYYFDSAKGFAIFSVILAHLNTFLNWDNVLLGYVISSYFMPLFFFISGYFAYKNERLKIVSVVKRKFKQLIIPYLSCFFICLIYASLFDVNILDRYLFDSSKGGYWFLIVLFAFSFIYILYNRLENILAPKFSQKLILFIVTLGFFWLFLCMIPLVVGKEISHLFCLPELRRFFPSFVLGLFCKMITPYWNIWNKKVLICSCIIYIALLLMGYNDKTMLGFLLWLLTSSTACLFLVNAFRVVDKRSIPILTICGENSLGIYIYHYVFIYALKAVIPTTLLVELPAWLTLLLFVVMSIVIAKLCVLLVVLTKKCRLGFLIGA